MVGSIWMLDLEMNEVASGHLNIRHHRVQRDQMYERLHRSGSLQSVRRAGDLRLLGDVDPVGKNFNLANEIEPDSKPRHIQIFRLSGYTSPTDGICFTCAMISRNWASSSGV